MASKGFQLFQEITKDMFDDEYKYVLENIDECLLITQNELDEKYDGNLEQVPIELFADCQFKNILLMENWFKGLTKLMESIDNLCKIDDE